MQNNGGSKVAVVHVIICTAAGAQHEIYDAKLGA